MVVVDGKFSVDGMFDSGLMLHSPSNRYECLAAWLSRPARVCAENEGLSFLFLQRRSGVIPAPDLRVLA